MDLSYILAEVNAAKSVWLQTGRLELYLTERAGCIAPAYFKLKHRSVNPYAFAPWLPSDLGKGVSDELRYMRGSQFLCQPERLFAKDLNPRSSAKRVWLLQQHNARRLELMLSLPKSASYSVKKRIDLNPNQRALYITHEIQAREAIKLSYGYQSMLDLNGLETKQRVATSPFCLGRTHCGSGPFSRDDIYTSLKPNYSFCSLGAVSSLFGPKMDMQSFPDRDGYDDQIMLSKFEGPYAWTAVSFDGYVWFSLKKTRDYSSTILWYSNGGWHGKPFEGRQQNSLIVTDCCSSFYEEGDDLETKACEETSSCPAFEKGECRSLVNIQGVHPVPKNFGLVQDIEFVMGKPEIIIRSSEGKSVTAEIDWQYLDNPS